ncbi:MAG: bifunctional hydroxymethylpyrimidine kinase/phosphomethylpyrimidine kinase [Pyrinomonadaceae bacterium]|nr:bifunctional hydroxymethylpyrimidine kinase/phosphomethylpyrimidine kinase [Pyrinomonadaceae bacterium]
MTLDRTILQERLLGIVKRFPQRRILVVGDSVADQFIFGAISRVSREAPVFILRHENTDTVPGGAANCALNLASLGASVSLISVCGEDEPGRALVAKLEAGGVDCSGLLISDKVKTTTKARILAGHLHSTRQQVIRIDYECKQLKDQALRERLRERVLEQAQPADAVVISDYGYGVADAEMAMFTRDAATARKVPVLADSRFSLSNFAEFTSATPNQDEVEKLLGREFSSATELESAGEELRERLGYRALLITRGGEGMLLLEDGTAAVHIDAIGAREPVDVTGAGDTVMAAYALALASDSSYPDAARLANYAGGLVVMKRGTASITAEELANSVLHSEM